MINKGVSEAEKGVFQNLIETKDQLIEAKNQLIANKDKGIALLRDLLKKYEQGEGK